MYYYPCRNCGQMEECNPMMNMPMMDMPMMNMPMMDMPMMNMPMMDMPMMDMPMMNMPMMDMPMMNMPMMNMPMMNMPMMNMPMEMQDCVDNEGDLIKMYPKIYIKMYPMVKHHCDMMEGKHGKGHCPSKEHMDRMCKEICDKCEEHHRGDEIEDFDENEDNDTRQRRLYGRRRGIQDLARILIIGSLIGRRRRFHSGY